MGNLIVCNLIYYTNLFILINLHIYFLIEANKPDL